MTIRTYPGKGAAVLIVERKPFGQVRITVSLDGGIIDLNQAQVVDLVGWLLREEG